MPLVRIADPLLVVIDVAAWGVIHAATGYAAHRIPLWWLERDRWLFRERTVERDGRVYERVLRIRSWKDRVPEAGGWFRGGLSKRQLPTVAQGGLARFAAETRRAETGHWLAAAGGPWFALWNPLPIAVVMVVYGVAVNAPFIAIQRYNRARVARVLRSRGARDERRSSASRRRRDTRGTSIPNGSPPSQ